MWQEESEKRIEEIDADLEDLSQTKYDVAGLDEKEKQMVMVLYMRLNF